MTMALNPKQFGSSVQLQLPGADTWETDARKEAVKGITVSSHDPDIPEDKARSFAHTALLSTKLPSTTLHKMSGTHIAYTPAPDYPQWAGEYFPESNTIAFNTKSHHDVMAEDAPVWMAHELGHTADFKELPNADNRDFLQKHSPERRSENFPTPDPRLEGVADGFMDKHVWGNKGYEHQTKTSYGMGVKDWSPIDTAIYHATRAHSSATGENLAVDYSGDHPEGEFLHKLVSRGPHAMKALKIAGLQDVAQEHMDKWKATRKNGTQLSLFGDSDYDTYDIPASHMSQQFKN